MDLLHNFVYYDSSSFPLPSSQNTIDHLDLPVSANEFQCLKVAHETREGSDDCQCMGTDKTVHFKLTVQDPLYIGTLPILEQVLCKSQHY